METTHRQNVGWNAQKRAEDRRAAKAREAEARKGWTK